MSPVAHTLRLGEGTQGPALSVNTLAPLNNGVSQDAVCVDRRLFKGCP
jgi:hypothetical protein